MRSNNPAAGRTEASAPEPVLPETSALFRVLLEACPASDTVPPVARIARREALVRGTSLKEFVTIEREDGSRQELFVKYAFGSYGAGDHRRGLEWEVRVYREHLRHLDAPVPELLAALRDGEGRLIAVFQRIVGGVPLSWDPRGLEYAAEWLGRFQRECAPSAGDRPELPRTSVSRAGAWIDAALLEPDLDAECRRMLAARRDRLLRALDDAARAAPALVHGELYGENVLIAAERAWVIDWESAAQGFPEIDVASLLENWSDEAQSAALDSYARSRWGSDQAPPADFRERLALGRLYWTLRWLPERIRWLGHPDVHGRDAEPTDESTRREWKRQIEEFVIAGLARLPG